MGARNALDNRIRKRILKELGFPYLHDFLTYINQIIPNDNGCWVWQGYINASGYGTMRVNGKNQLVHRWIYKTIHGDIDRYSCVCHHCDNKRCVNPMHCYKGSIALNTIDAVMKGLNHIPKSTDPIFSKLSYEKVGEIRELFVKGKTYNELSIIYGVDVSNISRIVRRKTWKNNLQDIS